MVVQAPFRDLDAQLWHGHVAREAACKRRSVSGKVGSLVQHQTEKELGRRDVRREERRARAKLRRALKDVSSHGLAKGAFYFDCAVSWLLSMGRKLGDGRGSWSLGQVYILNWFLQTLAPTFWHPAVWRNHHADLRKRYGWEEHRPICLANTFRQAGKTVATDAALAAAGLFAEYAETIGFFAQGIRVSEESLKECQRFQEDSLEIINGVLPNSVFEIVYHENSRVSFKIQKVDKLGVCDVKAEPLIPLAGEEMASASSSSASSASPESPLVSLRKVLNDGASISAVVNALERAYSRLRARMGANHFCASDGEAGEVLAILRELDLLADVRRPKGSPLYCVRHLGDVNAKGYLARVREAMEKGGTGLGVPLPASMQFPTVKTARDRIRKRLRQSTGTKPRGVTAKQLGLDESLAEFAGGKSPSHADEDEEQEEEEEEGEGEEQEEGEEEEEEQSVAERMSAEGLSFLTRLASELEEDENEPPRRRRPTGIPTPFQAEQAEFLSARCGGGNHSRACMRLMVASPSFKSMREAKQRAKQEGLPDKAEKVLDNMNERSLMSVFHQFSSEPFAREFLPWLNRRWREGVPLFPCNLQALFHARALMPELFWKMLQRELDAQEQKPVLIAMLVRDGKSLGGLQEREEGTPEMTPPASNHSTFF